jgi:hypothetical protein
MGLADLLDARGNAPWRHCRRRIADCSRTARRNAPLCMAIPCRNETSQAGPPLLCPTHGVCRGAAVLARTCDEFSPMSYSGALTKCADGKARARYVPAGTSLMRMRQGQEANLGARGRTSCRFGNNVAGARRLRSDVENPGSNRCSTLTSGPCGRKTGDRSTAQQIAEIDQTSRNCAVFRGAKVTTLCL